MSLLMQALRKAEEAKRAAQAGKDEAGTEAPQNKLALEPLPPSRNDDLSETAVDWEVDSPADTPPAPALAATEAPAPPPRPHQAAKPAPAPLANEAQRDARNLFAAKQGAPSSRRTFLLVTGGVTALAVIGIAAYVWWQLQPKSSLAPLPVAVSPPPPMPAPPAPASAAAPVVAPAETRPPPAASSTSDTPAPVAKPVQTVAAHDAHKAAPPPASPVRLSRNKPVTNPLALEAYEALQNGNLAQAQQLYQKLLASDPYQLDALYGLAALALQRNQPQLAETYYLRALEADPRDPVATAGLAGLREKSFGDNTESRLKTLIAEQPSPALHFALGNLYAREARWRDAQQAYFLAYQGDSESPDIAVNLAISLDQLHQVKPAIQYYNEALRLASRRQAAFNPAAIQARLRELQAP